MEEREGLRPSCTLLERHGDEDSRPHDSDLGLATAGCERTVQAVVMNDGIETVEDLSRWLPENGKDE